MIAYFTYRLLLAHQNLELFERATTLYHFTGAYIVSKYSSQLPSNSFQIILFRSFFSMIPLAAAFS